MLSDSLDKNRKRFDDDGRQGRFNEIPIHYCPFGTSGCRDIRLWMPVELLEHLKIGNICGKRLFSVLPEELQDLCGASLVTGAASVLRITCPKLQKRVPFVFFLLVASYSAIAYCDPYRRPCSSDKTCTPQRTHHGLAACPHLNSCSWASTTTSGEPVGDRLWQWMMNELLVR
jgi:hypothetical protein